MKTKTLNSALFVAPLVLSISAGHADLIAYWPFDDGEGGIAADVVGNYDANINGGSWTTTAQVGPWAFEGNSDEEVAKVYENGRLSLQVPDLNLAVTAIGLSSDQKVTLTWNSLEGDHYIVRYSTDLVNWEFDLGDNVPADVGDSTTRTFDLSGLDLPDTVYFRIEKP